MTTETVSSSRHQEATDKVKPFPVRNRQPVPVLLEPEVPYDPHAEEIVLGSILAEPKVLPDVKEILKPAYFFSEVRQKIYQVLLDMDVAGVPIELTLVRTQLKTKGLLGEGDSQIQAGELIRLPNVFNP